MAAEGLKDNARELPDWRLLPPTVASVDRMEPMEHDELDCFSKRGVPDLDLIVVGTSSVL